MSISTMDCVRLLPGSSAYPKGLNGGRNAGPILWARGNLDILQTNPLAFFCSIKCPGNLILKTYDLARELRDTGLTVMSGFHSPMEKECLALLLRGKQPIIPCPARGIEGMRLPAEWKNPLIAGRLLLLSPFPPEVRRPTADLARRRNEFIAALADRIFIAHAEPASRTLALALNALRSRKSVWTFASDENSDLIRAGAKPIENPSDSLFGSA